MGSVVQKKNIMRGRLELPDKYGMDKVAAEFFVFYDEKMPPKLKGRFFIAVVGPALSFGTEG